MIEKTGAIDVYFEDQIEILLEDPDAVSLDTVEDVLKAKEVEHTGVTPRSES